MDGCLVYNILSFYTTVDLVIVKTMTPLHAGVGRTSGVVDLPIQRDEYGYPCIYSSSLKGGLKTALLHAFLGSNKGNYEDARRAVQVLLGPEPEEGESFESSIAILDAYLLAIPARSLRGVYVYVTSPLLLKRFYERFELFKAFSQEAKAIEQATETIRRVCEEVDLEPYEALCIGNGCDKLRVEELEGRVVLVEEYFLDIKGVSDVVRGIDKEKLQKLQNLLEKILEPNKPLLIVSDKDEVSKNIVERSILRFTRVRLSRETKTVVAGPWTEEYLPPKTILHTLILYKKPPLSSSFIAKTLGKTSQQPLSDEDYLEALKKLNLLKEGYERRVKESSEVLERIRVLAEAIRQKTLSLLRDQLKNYVILGGHETIGKGMVRLEVIDFTNLQKELEVTTR